MASANRLRERQCRECIIETPGSVRPARGSRRPRRPRRTSTLRHGTLMPGAGCGRGGRCSAGVDAGPTRTLEERSARSSRGSGGTADEGCGSRTAETTRGSRASRAPRCRTGAGLLLRQPRSVRRAGGTTKGRTHGHVGPGQRLDISCAASVSARWDERGTYAPRWVLGMANRCSFALGDRSRNTTTSSP